VPTVGARVTRAVHSDGPNAQLPRRFRPEVDTGHLKDRAGQENRWSTAYGGTYQPLRLTAAGELSPATPRGRADRPNQLASADDRGQLVTTDHQRNRTAITRLDRAGEPVRAHGGDHLVQPDWCARHKQKHTATGRTALVVHAATYALTQALTKAFYRAAGMRVPVVAQVAGAVTEACCPSSTPCAARCALALGSAKASGSPARPKLHDSPIGTATISIPRDAR
jgi:hypothetical protein